MKSGGGVLCIGVLQVVVGLCLLGIYEGYKTHYLNSLIEMEDEARADERSSKEQADAGKAIEIQEEDDDGLSIVERNYLFNTPMDSVFYVSIISNVFSVLGLAGVVSQQKDLVTAFFTYNAVQMVVVFHYFVDLCADVGIRYRDQPPSLDAYEQAAAAFLFFNFCLSVCATGFALKAIDEIRTKQREQYTRMAVMGDTLTFEADT